MAVDEHAVNQRQSGIFIHLLCTIEGIKGRNEDM